MSEEESKLHQNPINPSPEKQPQEPELDRGYWVLQVPRDKQEWCQNKLLGRLRGAGLHYKAFWSSHKTSIIIFVFATLERLEYEAASSENNLWFPLDRDKLREADIAMNKNLQDHGLEFNPEEDGTPLPDDELAIPDMPTYLPGQDHFPPYMYIYGPYLTWAAKEGYYYKHRHGNFASAFDNLRTLVLIKQIMQAPRHDYGAGLDLHKLVGRGKLENFVPGNDESRRAYLKEEWLRLCKLPWDVPLPAIQNYYGSRIAMYFAFFQSYTVWLLFSGILGLIFFAAETHYDGTSTQSELVFFYAVIISIWSTSFSEKWKRNECVHSKKWGQDSQEERAPTRPAYIRSSEVYLKRSFSTGKPEYWRSPVRSTLKHVISDTTIATVIGIVIVLVVMIFWLRIVLQNVDNLSTEWASHISSIVTAVQIQVMSFLYHKLAHLLVNWENHPNETEHENSLALKLSCFQFINAYFSLFYIAYIKGSTSFFGENQACMKNNRGNEDCLFELEFQLIIIFATRVGMTFLNHLILPAIMPKIAEALPTIKARLMCKEPVKDDKAVDGSALGEESIAEKELEKPPYDPFNDYLDLMIQYGFVTLFVPAFPLAPFLATIVNILEIRLDSYKLLKLTSRPAPRQASGIGSWRIVLRFLTIISVVTNITLIVFTDDQPWFGVSDQYLQFGIAVVAEHVILGLKFLVEELIPDVPHNVTIQRRRQEYLVDKHLLDSKEADEVAALNGHLKNDDVDPEDAEIAITEAEIGETISEAVSSLQKEKQGDDA
eukprot:gb/GECG01016803.1/.p1 GENE.gb/GECG01016803.1/~~gb/GECG01016803.1/.p1  ORF type:complete len:772 (+),score=100.00 gb/GECG01016803.1/:1-2316(+)